jgi:CubicO group peptidase (beta-lactamase class C family)
VPLLAWLLAACGGTRDATAPVAPPAPPAPAPVVGALQVTVSGLPAGAAARVTVTGPGGTFAVTGTSTLSVAPGRYTITAVQVAAGPALYDPLEASQQRDVLGGATAAVAVGHTLSRAAHPVVVRLVDSVRAAFNLPALAGAIVTAEDRVVAWGVAGTRRATGGAAVTVNDLWHLGSNFKAFTGTLAAVAVSRGVIAYGTTLAEAFPELVSSMRAEYRGVTLRDLLAHRAGLPRDPAGVAITGATRTEQRQSVTQWAVQQPPATTPGTYSYTNTGYMLAGAMLERALGVSFEEAMARHVWTPLGITNAGWGAQAAAGSSEQPVSHSWQDGAWRVREAFDNPPVYASAGGAHMTLDGWSRFLQEVLRMEAGTTSLAPLAIQRETTASIAATGSDAYGLGWFITSRSWAGGRTLTHNGTNTGFGSVTWMAPLRGFAVLATTNSWDTVGNRSASAMDVLVGRLISFRETGR